MGTPMTEASFFGTEKISRILLKIAPPVMPVQLIQAMYNIVDSFLWGSIPQTPLLPLRLFIRCS